MILLPLQYKAFGFNNERALLAETNKTFIIKGPRLWPRESDDTFN
jgi:hypothetical protein